MRISVEEFWGLNPKYIELYQEQYIAEKEEQMKMLDVSAFYHGLYVQLAVASLLDKKTKYPRSPLSMMQKKNVLSGEERFKLWIEEHNRRFLEKQGAGAK